jgi:hypothetical protein
VTDARRGRHCVEERNAVIWESRYWKKPLIAMAGRIEAAGKAGWKPTDRRMVQIERDLFIGCYSIRKLVDASLKLTDACRGSKVKLRCHSAKGTPVSLFRRDDIDKHYDLEKGLTEHRGLEFFCGRIIHSITFVVELDDVEGSLCGFYFGSDLDREKRLYHVAAAEVIRTFRLVGEDYPTHVSSEIDPVTGKEIFEAR